MDEQKITGEILDSEEKKGMVHIVKQIVRKNRDVVGAGCVEGSQGEILTDEDGVKNRWKGYFKKLLNEKFGWDKDGLAMVDEVSEPAEIITYSEVKAAITRAKSGKAASGAVAEMLTASEDNGVKWVTDLCNSIVQDGKPPNDWNKI